MNIKRELRKKRTREGMRVKRKEREEGINLRAKIKTRKKKWEKLGKSR